MKLSVEGNEYDVVQMLGEHRAIIYMSGFYVFVDRVRFVDDDAWMLSDELPTKYERRAIEDYVDTVKVPVFPVGK